MIISRAIISAVTAALMILMSCTVFADTKGTNEEAEKMFQTLDKNKDSKVSKDEWNRLDRNKNNEITPDEWKKYHFKSSKRVKWFDNNGDSLMTMDEFLNNFHK